MIGMRFLIKTSVLIAFVMALLVLMAGQAAAAPIMTGGAECGPDGTLLIGLSGAGASPGSMVDIYAGGSLVGSAVSDASGDWSFVFTSAPLEGSLNVSAYVSGILLAGTSIDLPQCTTLGPPPTTLAATLTGGAQCLPDGQIQINLSGSGAPPNSQIDIYLDGSLFTSTMSDVNGDWSLVTTVPAATGPGTFNVTAIVGGDMLIAETVLTLPNCPDPDPTPPTITVQADCIGGQITVSGTGAPPFTTFHVFMGPDTTSGQLLGTVTSDGAGSWSLVTIVPGSLSPGTYYVWADYSIAAIAANEPVVAKVTVQDCTQPPPPPTVHIKQLPNTGSRLLLLAAMGLALTGMAAAGRRYARKRA
jgi:LPXTG-motif cell wall-anchored protein